ncbi:unnamed protein product [Closterium sp. NIES-54]
MVGVVESTVSQAPEAGEDFKAVAAAVQVNPMVVPLDIGCSHHLMGTKEVFVEMMVGGDVKHVRGFNGALQNIEGRGIVTLQRESGKQILVPNVLYVPGVQANLHSAGQVKYFAKPSTIGKRQAEEPAEEKSAEEPTAEEKLAEKKSAAEAAEEKSALEPTLMDHLDDGTSSNVVEVLSGKEGELSAGEQFDDSDVTEVSVEEVKPRRSTRSNLGKPTKKLSYHACLPSTSYNTLLNDTEADVDLPELDPDIHADPEHRWDIANMTVKEALASWKGKALKAAMDKDIRRLITNGTWELLERTRGVNVMKSWWVLMTKYHVNDIVAREKARLVVKGFTKVCGADYDETYTPVGSYVTLWIFLSIVAVLDVHLMQLDMKNAFLQSKLDRVPYMYQLNYYNDGTGRVCKLLKSLYRLKQSPLLWYLVLDVVLTSADCQKSQVDEALYFKVRADGVACWVLVYVDGLLSASSSCEMLKELKELLEATFDLRKTSPIEKYLRLEIVHDRPAKKLWLHQQSYVDKLRWRFNDNH